MNTIDWALFYAELGWPVFPLAEGSKLPKIAKTAGGRGFHDATTDASQLGRWFGHWPRANVGIRTGSASGLIVLDVDIRHRGDESLRGLVKTHGKLPNTLQAHTPSGGLHFFFEQPDVELRNSAGLLDDGLDTRGEGGYVAAAPSVVARVGEYQWVNWGTETAPLPTWLVKLLRKPVYNPPSESTVLVPRKIARTFVERIVADRVQKVLTAPISRRNNTLNAQAFYLGTFVGAGLLDSERVWVELTAAAARIGLAERETRATVASGLSAGIATPARWAS